MRSLVQSMREWRTVAHDKTPELMERAHQIVAWSNLPYYESHLKWLREQADKPIEPKSPHADLIVSNARANTFKEIRQHLIDEVSRANRALESENAR